MQLAEQLLQQASTTPTDIEQAENAFKGTTFAFKQITHALTPFQETIAVTKKTNPFLAKLQAAHKALAAQTQALEKNRELITALEDNPAAKTRFKEEILPEASAANQEVQSVIEIIDKPTVEIKSSEKEKKLVELIQRTTSEESKLDHDLKKFISVFSLRAIPLTRIQASRQLSGTDSDSIYRMVSDYYTCMTYIYTKLKDATETSASAYNELCTSMKNDGIHDLADFINTEYDPEFKRLATEIWEEIGDQLLNDLVTRSKNMSKLFEAVNAFYENLKASQKT